MIDMTPSLVLVLAIVGLVTVGVYLMLERSLSRVVIGVIALGNGINLMFLVAGGRAGTPPIIGNSPEWRMSDPLPQAMVLTAIVITLGISAFLLAMAYRSWQLNAHDEVQDDLEDRRIARLAETNVVPPRSTDDAGTTLAEEAALARDETSVLPDRDRRGRRGPGIGLDDEELR